MPEPLLDGEPTAPELWSTATSILEEELLGWREMGELEIPDGIVLDALAEEVATHLVRTVDLVSDTFMEDGASALATFIDAHEDLIRIGETLDCDPSIFQFLSLYVEKGGSVSEKKSEPKPAGAEHGEVSEMVQSLAAHLLKMIADEKLELAQNVTGHDTEAGRKEITLDLAGRFLETIRKQVSPERFEEMLIDWLCEQPDVDEVF